MSIYVFLQNLSTCFKKWSLVDKDSVENNEYIRVSEPTFLQFWLYQELDGVTVKKNRSHSEFEILQNSNYIFEKSELELLKKF